jgi:hypothetical protein
MVLLFFSVAVGAFVCAAGPTVSCSQMPSHVLQGLIAAGAVEMIFETIGFKVYKNREDKKDD